MADFHQWIDRLKDYGHRVAQTYASGLAESAGLGRELAGKQQQVQQYNDVYAPDTQVMPGPPAAMPQGLAPYAPPRQGYAPLPTAPGDAALQQLYAGHPPDLRNQGVTQKSGSRGGF
jgi:hypothetical protein